MLKKLNVKMANANNIEQVPEAAPDKAAAIRLLTTHHGNCPS